MSESGSAFGGDSSGALDGSPGGLSGNTARLGDSGGGLGRQLQRFGASTGRGGVILSSLCLHRAGRIAHPSALYERSLPIITVPTSTFAPAPSSSRVRRLVGSATNRTSHQNGSRTTIEAPRQPLVLDSRWVEVASRTKSHPSRWKGVERDGGGPRGKGRQTVEADERAENHWGSADGSNSSPSSHVET
jgi:hypothetical protein